MGKNPEDGEQDEDRRAYPVKPTEQVAYSRKNNTRSFGRVEWFFCNQVCRHG